MSVHMFRFIISTEKEYWLVERLCKNMLILILALTREGLHASMAFQPLPLRAKTTAVCHDLRN